MAIQISGTTVIDDSRNITNIDTICGDSADGDWVATREEAENGFINNQLMTPLRVRQAIAALGCRRVDDDIVWSGCNVGCAVRGGGNVFYKQSGIIWIVAPSTVQTVSTWPMGFCNGDSGDTPNKAQRITGRSGWFVPDIGMLQCGYACRTYWDSFSNSNYWSSTECGSSGAYYVTFNFGCTMCNLKCGIRCVRPFRVVCY